MLHVYLTGCGNENICSVHSFNLATCFNIITELMHVQYETVLQMGQML